jgi:hypothetical protein
VSGERYRGDADSQRGFRSGEARKLVRFVRHRRVFCNSLEQFFECHSGRALVVEINRWLRACMRETLQSQRLDLAAVRKTSGLSRPWLHRELEAGNKTPTVEFVLSVSRYYGISTDELIRDEIELSVSRIEAGE